MTNKTKELAAAGHALAKELHCPESAALVRELAAQLDVQRVRADMLAAQSVEAFASKRGFTFQHGSIHAHFGNGDVMVGSVTFENGDAGICFAPVREKTGGIGTHYDWTKEKTPEQVDSVFVIASTNAAGLEVIQGKLAEAIDQLREGK